MHGADSDTVGVSHDFVLLMLCACYASLLISHQYCLPGWYCLSIVEMPGMQDLHAKTAVWSTLFYGPLNYLLCYGAAGARLQLMAIERGAHTLPVAVSRTFDMTNPAGHAQVVLAAFGLYRLLSTVNILLPAYVLPVGKDLTASSTIGQHAFKRTLHFRADSATV